VLFVTLAIAHSAAAQSRFEIGGGVSWTGGFDAGGANALLTRNPATGSSPLALFDTSSRVNAAPGATVSVAYFLTRAFAVEATADYSRPVLQTTIANDFEGATGTTAQSRLRSIEVGGSLLYHFGAARLTPFVFGGAGWMRQLDENDVMLVTGTELHAGGGVKYRVDRHVALRVQAGASERDKSIAFADGRRVLPAVSAGVVYRW
jgi:hypothetical protein